MTKSTAKCIGRHILAVFCSTGVLGIGPILAYAAVVIWSGDMGGPLNLILVPILSAMLGFTISIVAFLPLGLLTERFNFHYWLRLMGRSTVILAAIVILGWAFVFVTEGLHGWSVSIAVAFSFCLFLIAGFFVYLCCLALCKKVFPGHNSNSIPCPDPASASGAGYAPDNAT